MKKIINKIRYEIGTIKVSYAVIGAVTMLFGGLISSLSTGNRIFYSMIKLPSFAPPGFLFPIVWTLLYILIGAAAGAVFGVRGRCYDVLKYKGISLFVIMAALNFLWYPLFFGSGLYLLAFIDIVFMIILTLSIIVLFSKILTVSALAMVPYLFWLIFASAINIAVVFMN